MDPVSQIEKPDLCVQTYLSVHTHQVHLPVYALKSCFVCLPTQVHSCKVSDKQKRDSIQKDYIQKLSTLKKKKNPEN